MNEAYMKIANSPVMWIACGIPLIWVIIQAIVYYQKSKKAALAMGITPIQIRHATKSASIASIGPCFVMITTMLSLMLNVGAPLAWLRVDFIGSVSYELTGAQMTADAMGIEMGGPQMDANFLCAAAIVMTTGCIAWIIFTLLFADKMEKVNMVMAGGNKALIPALGAGAIIGCYSSLTVDRVFPIGPNIWAIIVSGGLMMAMTFYNKKAKKQWIKDWGTSLCMVSGMISATIASMI